MLRHGLAEGALEAAGDRPRVLAGVCSHWAGVDCQQVREGEIARGYKKGVKLCLCPMSFSHNASVLFPLSLTGVQDHGEPGVEGQKVHLKSCCYS